MVDSVAGVFVPVEVLTREQGTTADAVIEKIQTGALIGRKQSNGWHVMVRAPATAEPAAAPTAVPAVVPVPPPPARAPAPAQVDYGGPIRIAGVTEVVVRDVQIRFTAMIALILKFLLACIPVTLILGGIALGGYWLYQKYGGLVTDLVKPYLL